MRAIRGSRAIFRGKTNRESLEASFLDEHASALSFLSEAGLRFFLPVYLRADVREELKLADSVITGFWAVEVKVIMHGRDFLVRSGKSELLNPRRYGAATFYDHARYRFSIFMLEEAGAIVAYLEYKRDVDPVGPDAARIDAAVDGYCRERAKNAPAVEDLRKHIQEKAQFVGAIGTRPTEPPNLSALRR